MQASDGVVAASRTAIARCGLRLHPSCGCSAFSRSWWSALAILLFAGLAAVIGRVIYLASPSATQPAAAPDARHPAGAEPASCRPGAQVRSVSLSGNRLAVHYEVGGGRRHRDPRPADGAHGHQHRGRAEAGRHVMVERAGRTGAAKKGLIEGARPPI